VHAHLSFAEISVPSDEEKYFYVEIASDVEIAKFQSVEENKVSVT